MNAEDGGFFFSWQLALPTIRARVRRVRILMLHLIFRISS